MSTTYFAQIIDFYKAQKRMPTYSEIMKITGLKSKGAVAYVVNRCVEEGILSKDSTGKLIPEKITSGVPMLGSVVAGFPTTEEQEVSEAITLDEMLITKKDDTFLSFQISAGQSGLCLASHGRYRGIEIGVLL